MLATLVFWALLVPQMARAAEALVRDFALLRRDTADLAARRRAHARGRWRRAQAIRAAARGHAGREAEAHPRSPGAVKAEQGRQIQRPRRPEEDEPPARDEPPAVGGNEEPPRRPSALPRATRRRRYRRAADLAAIGRRVDRGHGARASRPTSPAAPAPSVRRSRSRDARAQPSLALSYSTSGGELHRGHRLVHLAAVHLAADGQGSPPRTTSLLGIPTKIPSCTTVARSFVLVSSSVATSIDGAPVPPEPASWQQYRAKIEGRSCASSGRLDSQRWV